MVNLKHLSTLVVLTLGAGIASAQPDSPPRPSVPDINARAVRLVKPAFPETALAVGGDGSTLSVKVVVNEVGDVVSAVCSLNCHPLLKEPAELAAAASKFGPLTVNGRTVEYEGILLYHYVSEKVYWSRFGTALESVRQFDNLSAGPVAQMLPAKFAVERNRLLSIDKEGVDFATRQKTISEVEAAVRARLTGIDLWRFDTSLALRRITFWPMAAEKIDRAALESAIDALQKHIKAAPDAVDPELITKLTELSRYRFSPEMPEQQLRQDLMKLTRMLWLEPNDRDASNNLRKP